MTVKLDAHKENGRISISEDSFEYLLNCLDHQKYTHEENEDQKAIDDFNRQCRGFLNTSEPLPKGMEVLSVAELKADHQWDDIESPEEFIQIVEKAISDGKYVLPADNPRDLRKGFMICDSVDSGQGRRVNIRLIDLKDRQEWLDKIYKIAERLTGEKTPCDTK